MRPEEAVALAATWQPHGEEERLRRLHPKLVEMYSQIVVALPPDTEAGLVRMLEDLPQVKAVVTMSWPQGRHAALVAALRTQADYAHCVDLDRLLRWAETLPEELTATITRIRQADCLVIGRSDAAWATHPQAMQQTEAMFNTVFSQVLGREMDIGAGARGFGRSAMEFLLRNSPAERGVYNDAEWPVLLQRGGFALDYLAVDGLDWETADRYQSRAADREAQQQAAEGYDQDARRWAFRARVARAILDGGLKAMGQALVEKPPS